MTDVVLPEVADPHTRNSLPAVTWSELFEWWLSEVQNDPAYQEVVTPLLLEILHPEPGLHYLDVGCGEGRVMRSLTRRGALVMGLDISFDLVRQVERALVADLVSIPFRGSTFDGAYCVLTLEHVEDHPGFFAEAARVVRDNGVLAIVVNHPTWTAPHSTPISDSDGEVLWRPGLYFSGSSSQVPAGDSVVTFYHRTFADLLNAAADKGWRLERLIELPHHEFEDQAGIPRLLAVRWRLSP